jgi:DNA polymerase-3 subunit beta
MIISCLQENLARGLNIVGRAVSTRSTLPVLGNVLLEMDNGRLKLSATNLEIVVTCWIGAKVEEEGAITVPHRTLNDLVSTLPQEPVNIELNVPTQTLHISCGRTDANVKGIDAQEFPLIPKPDQANRVRLETAVFKQMISQVAMAAAVDDSRPTLTGVSIAIENNHLLMVATDGFRLSMKSANIPSIVETPMNLIVPAKALLELARISNDDNDAIYISMPEGRNQIIFDMDNIVLVSQLIDGNFPDYTPIVPVSNNTRTVMGTAEFRKACKTAEIFARESSHTARVRIEPGADDFSTGFATVTANSAETGDNIAQIDASVEGEPIEIAFNVKYMTDVLNVIDTPQVALETTNAMEPGVIKPVGDTNFVHIIMPMHFGR